MPLHEFGVRQWSSKQPTPTRKSGGGLPALVRQKLAGDMTSRQLFVFINHKCSQLKVRKFEQGSYCLGRKRLEVVPFIAKSLGSSSDTGTAQPRQPVDKNKKRFR